MRPRARFGPKTPRGVHRLEVLQGLRRNYFVFCLNFRQVQQINQSYGSKKVFLSKIGILGAFLAIKSPPGTRTRFQKRVNREVSGIGTCKFEFSTIKTPIMTYKMAFSTNIRKSPQKGVLSSPKSPQGTRSGVLPGSTITILCSHQLSSNFWKVSEKSNGGIKSYGAKVSFFAISGHFGAFLPFLSPWDAIRVFSQKNFLQCTTRYKNTTSGKISQKSNGWLSGNNPDTRTDARH